MEAALTLAETETLTKLETVIERGLQTFVEVGNALMEIRDGRLYRQQFGTFEDYCRERWGIVASRARQLIGAANVVANLSVTTVTPVLPANEAQVRPLSKLTPQLQTTVWPIVVDTAPGGKITANHVQRVVDDYLRSDERLDAALTPALSQGERKSEFNYKRDTKSARPVDIYTPQGYDGCQTPAYAIRPLLPYLQPSWHIWEPACGEGYLERALCDGGFGVTSSDILTGQNFFEFEPERWDCLITNPPFSLKYKFLTRCYQLGKPFALLMPVETLGTESAAVLFEQYGVEIIFVRPRINFKMPHKGWEGGGAQFPVAWFTWGLSIGQAVSFVKVVTEEG